MTASPSKLRWVLPSILCTALAIAGLAGCESGDSNARTVVREASPRSVRIPGRGPARRSVVATAPKRITTVEGITEYRLGNGLQVLLFPDPSKPTVTVNVTYLVGSRHEGRGEAGMAHLLEHMVFKGTPTYKNIWGALEDHGASFNGSTWVDRTNYFETLPASDENLEFALHMESDRMVNSFISAEELAKEMTVVRNEFEMGENNPIGVLSERMMSAAYLWHNYGKSTIGNRSDIERVPAESLKRFYRKNYQPDNAMLVVAGKFDPEKTLALINKYFGTIPRPSRVLEKTYTEEPTQDGPRFVTLDRVGDVSAAGLIYHTPAGSHEDCPAVQVLEEVLTSQPAGRLYKALVETGKASRVFGSAYSWAEPGVMEIMAQVRQDQDARAVLEEMKRVVEGVATADITDEEVERVKTRRLKNIKLALTNSGRIGVQLSEWAALGDWRMLFIHRDRIKKVTTEDVRRVAAKYLIESNRTAGLFIPDKEPIRATIPPTPDVEAIARDYKGTETIEAGEVFVATPENIERRTKRFELPGGAKVAMLSKQTRGDAVRASFRFHFGTEEALNGHQTALELIPTMLMRGSTEHDYQALRDEIDRLQSRIRVFGGTGTFAASIESDREHIVAAIELVGEILQKPAFKDEEFSIITKERLAQAEESLSDP
ncbi:MAG: insulinase family protein, partial [Phycisphaerae bacterium]